MTVKMYYMIVIHEVKLLVDKYHDQSDDLLFGSAPVQGPAKVHGIDVPAGSWLLFCAGNSKDRATLARVTGQFIQVSERTV